MPAEDHAMRILTICLAALAIFLAPASPVRADQYVLLSCVLTQGYLAGHMLNVAPSPPRLVASINLTRRAARAFIYKFDTWRPISTPPFGTVWSEPLPGILHRYAVTYRYDETSGSLEESDEATGDAGYYSCSRAVRVH
jgi:hypothetical protein